MAEITLKATTGRKLGTGPSKQLRVAGQVPGVVYGLDADPLPVAVEWRPLREALTTDAGLNVLLDLDIDGDHALCIVKELQRHAIRGDVVHLDFLRVSADVEVSVDIPIILHGEALQVLRDNGTVDHVLFTLTVNAKPADIPNEITVDVSGLVIGDTIRVGDLTLAPGVSTDVDPEEAVVSAQVSAAALEVEALDAEHEAEMDEVHAEEAAAEASGGDSGGSDEG
jgi:large subunit ribosomal protein L25